MPRNCQARAIWCDRGWLPAYYGFCPSERAWRYEMKRLGVAKSPPYPRSDARCSYFHNKDGDLVVLVTVAEHLDKKLSVASIAGLIVHEAMHVWRRIRKSIGERKPSSEFEAYAMQTIFMELFSAYVRTRRKGVRFVR